MPCFAYNVAIECGESLKFCAGVKKVFLGVVRRGGRAPAGRSKPRLPSLYLPPRSHEENSDSHATKDREGLFATIGFAVPFINRFVFYAQWVSHTLISNDISAWVVLAILLLLLFILFLLPPPRPEGDCE